MSRWALIILGVVAAIGFVFGYILDEAPDPAWSAIATILGIVMLGIVLFGLFTVTSDAIVVLMFSAIVFWLASIVAHLIAQQPVSQHPA